MRSWLSTRERESHGRRTCLSLSIQKKDYFASRHMREAIFTGSVDPTRISQLDVPMVAVPTVGRKK